MAHRRAEVEARTAELASVNAQLRTEIAARTVADHQLRLADRRKDEFLATLAHKLRNPLAPIRHSLKLLNVPGVDDPKRQRGRQVIERQVRRMAGFDRHFTKPVDPGDLQRLLGEFVAGNHRA